MRSSNKELEMIVKIRNENISTFGMSSKDFSKSDFVEKFDREDLKDIAIGDSLTIQFNNIKPDKITVIDVLLKSNGEYSYTSKESQEVPLEYENDKFYFKLQKHIASALSSFYQENKTEYRGFKVFIHKDGVDYTKGFVLKTTVPQ